MRAVVDIGSNSVKFTAAGDKLAKPITGSWVTRLGSGSAQKLLLPEAVAKTRHALNEIRTALVQAAGSLDGIEIKIVATSAVRDARNPEEVTRLAESILGVPVRVLTGLEEARVSLEGAASASQSVFGHRESLFLDMGGASTEVGMISPVFHAHSFQAGAVRCHEAFGFGKSAIGDAAWQAARTRVAEFFPDTDWRPLFKGFRATPRACVAVGGTLVLASKLVPEAADHMPAGRVVTHAQVQALGEKLRVLDVEDRFKIPYMVEGRADIVVTGLLILEHLLERSGLETVLVTDWGLRNGLLANWTLL